MHADDYIVRTLLRKWRVDLFSMTLLLSDLIHKNLEPDTGGGGEAVLSRHHKRKGKGSQKRMPARRGVSRIQSRNYNL